MEQAKRVLNEAGVCEAVKSGRAEPAGLRPMRNRKRWLAVALWGLVALAASRPAAAAWYANRAALSLLQDAGRDAAQAWLERAAQLNPASASPPRLLLRAAIARGDADAAARLLDAPAFSWERDYAQALLVGALYGRRGERAAGEALWRRACAANPRALQVLANALSRPVGGLSLSPDAATAEVLVELAREAAQRRDVPVAVYIDVGRALFLQLGQPEAARDWFRAAQAQYPHDAGVLYHLYALAMALGDYDAALPGLEELASSPGRAYWMSERELHLARGGLLLRDPARLAEATAELEAAVRVDPASSYARLRLGLAYEGAGRMAEAREQLAQVLQLAPEPGVDVEWVRRHIAELER